MQHEYYHQPPDVDWDAASIAESFCDLGYGATVVDDQVVLKVVVSPDSSWIGKTIDALLPGRTGDFSIRIAHDSERFIRNVQIQRDAKMPLDTCQDPIREVLTRHGMISLSIEQERAIARKYCSDVDKLEQIEMEIERQQIEKERHVQNQDFEAAVEMRDLEIASRERLDTIVMNAAAKGS